MSSIDPTSSSQPVGPSPHSIPESNSVSATEHERYWEELFEPHNAPIRQFLRHLTRADSDVLDDLAANTWVRVLEKGKSFRGEKPFERWLRGVARSVATDQQRSDVARQKREARVALDPEQGESFGRVSDSKLDLERISSVLSEDERRLLRCLEKGLSHEDIAQELDLSSVEASQTRKYRLLEKLRKAFPELDGAFYGTHGARYIAHVPRVTVNLSLARVMHNIGWEGFPKPLPEDYEASARNRARFEKTMADIRLLETIGAWAQKIRGTRSFDSFNGLSALLDALLPRDRDAQDQVAGALHLHPVTLAAMRTGERIATEIVAEPVVRLCTYLGLNLDTMLLLIERDLDNNPDSVVGLEGLQALRDAWKSYHS